MRITLVVVLGFWCANVSAQNVTAGRLAEMCGVTKNSSVVEFASCDAYMVGAIDQARHEATLRAYALRKELEPARVYLGEKLEPWPSEEDKMIILVFCPPDSVTGQQMLAVVTKFLRDNPVRWHESAAPLVIKALRDAFPCKLSVKPPPR